MFWFFFLSHRRGTQVLFLVIHTHLRKSSAMILQHQWKLGEDRLQASSSLGQKKLWLMAFLFGLSIVTHACFIVLPAAPIAPFVTTVWSDLIIIALGWVNVLDCATTVSSSCLFPHQLFFASTCFPCQRCTLRF
uniref:Protein S-acyltransferase 8 n=1 Tax=Rhizophora mucronata TaxID=61149 RepID=A0A2P2JI74_RHIMU